MGQESVTFKMEGEALARLDDLASGTARNRTYHLRRAVEAYLNEEAEFLEEVRQGIANADAGRLVPHETVRERLREFILKDEE